MTETIFSKIIAGEIAAPRLYEDEDCICIKDIHPQAPTHVLIIPKTAIAKLSDAQADHQALLGHLLLVAGKVARQLGVENAFRLVINNGEAAGQSVFHLHVHLLANQTFSEASLV
jgi:histidine triad (HIT) family protein